MKATVLTKVKQNPNKRECLKTIYSLPSPVGEGLGMGGRCWHTIQSQYFRKHICWLPLALCVFWAGELPANDVNDEQILDILTHFTASEGDANLYQIEAGEELESRLLSDLLKLSGQEESEGERDHEDQPDDESDDEEREDSDEDESDDEHEGWEGDGDESDDDERDEDESEEDMYDPEDVDDREEDESETDDDQEDEAEEDDQEDGGDEENEDEGQEE